MKQSLEAARRGAYSYVACHTDWLHLDLVGRLPCPPGAGPRSCPHPCMLLPLPPPEMPQAPPARCSARKSGMPGEPGKAGEKKPSACCQPTRMPDADDSKSARRCHSQRSSCRCAKEQRWGHEMRDLSCDGGASCGAGAWEQAGRQAGRQAARHGWLAAGAGRSGTVWRPQQCRTSRSPSTAGPSCSVSAAARSSSEAARSVSRLLTRRLHPNSDAANAANRRRHAKRRSAASAPAASAAAAAARGCAAASALQASGWDATSACCCQLGCSLSPSARCGSAKPLGAGPTFGNASLASAAAAAAAALLLPASQLMTA